MTNIEILLIEDNVSDVDLVKMAITNGKILANLHIVSDGAQATSFLFKEKGYENSPTPDLVLSDLHLPQKSGHEILKELRNTESTKHIPFVIMTTSDMDEDILNSYQLTANCFLTKPVDAKKFVTMIHELSDFWFKVVKLPQN